MSNIPEHIFNEEFTEETPPPIFREEREGLFLNIFRNMVDDYNLNIRNYNDNINNTLYRDHDTNMYNQNISRYIGSMSESIQLLRDHSHPPERIVPRSNIFSQALPGHYIPINRNVIFPSNTRILTPVQISDATENSIYNENPDENSVCPISLEEFSSGDEITKIKGCGHIFKKLNLHRWLLQSSICPNCRYDIYESIPGIAEDMSHETEQLLTQISSFFRNFDTSTPPHTLGFEFGNI